jgi:hypothetical protein
MACEKEELRHVPLFGLLDDEELGLLGSLIELRKFAARQRIYKIADPADRAYVMLSGAVRVTTLDEDHQEVIVDEPRHGEFFGFASMIERVPTPHQRACPGRLDLPGGKPGRHRDLAAAQTDGRHGHDDRPRPPVSRGAGAGAPPRQP